MDPQFVQSAVAFAFGAVAGAAFVWFAVPKLKAKLDEARAALKAKL